MIRPRKALAVASFEFLSTVKRKGYLIATFGMPVFMIAYLALVGGISVFAAKKSAAPKLFGVVDLAAVLDLAGDTRAAGSSLPAQARELLESAGRADALKAAEAAAPATTTFRPFPTEEAASAALASGEVKGYFVVAADYLATGRVNSVVREGSPLESDRPVKHLGELLAERLLRGRVEEQVARLIRDPVQGGESWTVKPDGTRAPYSQAGEISRFAVPFVFAILLMISLLASAGYLLQAVATEKENKVVEVLLSSADPDEILAGKLLGLGAAGLIQISVWFGMAAAGGLLTTTALAIAGVEMPWLAIALAVPYFVLGYLLVGSLMLGTAALGSTMRESQQLSMVWTIPTIIPLVTATAIIADPHGILARVMTFVPFTAPLTSILRLSVEPSGIGWWEIPLSLALLCATIWFAIKVGARLFRIGVLLGGARPKLGEIVRQALARPRAG